MKNFKLQNRFSLFAIIGLFALAIMLVTSAQPSAASLARTQSSASYSETADVNVSVVAKIESIFAVSAKHVFDEDYWIANMHSIQSF